jgi:O-antigen/teichoic acid export membrane protein
MSFTNTITKNLFVMLASDVLGRVLSFAYIIIIARYLLAAGLGKYAFVFSFVELFAVFSNFGLNMVLVRDTAANSKKLKKYISRIAGLKIALSIFAVIAASIAILSLKQQTDVKIAVIIISLTYCFLNFRDLFSHIYQSQQKLEYAALFNTLERVITFVIGTIVLVLTKNFLAFITVFLVSYAITFIVGLALVRKDFGNINPKIDLAFSKKILIQGFPFLLIDFFYLIYFKIDTVMLSFMKDYVVVGFYNAAYSTLTALYFIPGAFIAALFPVMAQKVVKNRKVLETIYKKAFLLLFVIGLPIGIGVTILSDRFVHIIYGPSFAPSSPALQILIWAEVIIFVSYITSYVLLSMKKQKIVVAATIFGAIFNIALNLILIPKYSYIGAAIATLATELVVFSIFMYFLRKNGMKLPFDIKLINTAIAGIILFALIYLIKNQHIAIIVTISAAAYIILLYLLKILGQEDVIILKNTYKEFIAKKR